MGYWSEKQIDDQARYTFALEILCETGTLETCERHGTYFEGNGDLTAAYKLANYKLSEDGGASPEERRALTDAIKAAYEENGVATRCERCADNRD